MLPVKPPSDGMSGHRKRRLERAAMQHPAAPAPMADTSGAPTQHGEPAGVDMILSQLADQQHPVRGGM